MGTVQTIKTPQDIESLLDLRRSATGFQRAHIVGEAFAKAFSGNWFSKLFGKADKGYNDSANGILAPEASRGGFILGAAVHNKEHVLDFNNLFYNADPDVNVRASSPKWMNKLETDLRREFRNAEANYAVLPESERGSAILGACNATTTAIVPANDNGTHAAREAA